jgi:hypothetical protein
MPGRCLYLNLLRVILSILIISSLYSIVLFDTAIAHNPSEEADNAHAHNHQLPSPWPLHLILVSVGSVSLAGGILAARYRKHRIDWISLHKKMVLLGAASILAGLSVAAYMVSRYMETYFVQEPHAYLGASTFGFIVATPILGIAQFRLKDKRIRIMHRWSGRITMVLIIATILAGIQMVLMVLS